MQVFEAGAHSIVHDGGVGFGAGEVAEMGVDGFETFEVAGYRCGGGWFFGWFLTGWRFEVLGGCLCGDVSVEEFRWV